MHSCVTALHDKEGAMYSGLLLSGEGDSRVTQFELLTHTCIIARKCPDGINNNNVYIILVYIGEGL